LLRLPRRGMTAIGVFGFVFAMIAAGCSGGGSSNSSSSTAPSFNATPSTAACASGTGGVAYIPDGGANPHGITIQPFEDTTGAFDRYCTSRFLASSSAIMDLSISAYGDALAVAGNTLVGLAGFTTGGSPYFTSYTQTTANSVVANFSSAVLLPGGTFGVAVDNEQPGPGPTAGVIGANNIFGTQPTPYPTAVPTSTASAAPNATATAYDPAVVNPAQLPYINIGLSPSASPQPTSTPLADPAGSVYGRATIAVGPDGQTLLARGDKDIIALQVTPTTAGYFFTYPAVGAISSPIINSTSGVSYGLNTGLGYPTTIPTNGAGFGRGLVAFSPATATRALIGGLTAGSPTTITLLNDVPVNVVGASNAVSFISGTTGITANLTSLAINLNGDVAAVGTANGLYIFNGITNNKLTPVPQTTASPAFNSYTVAGSTPAALRTIANVVSVAFSVDGRYLLVLADNGDGTGSLLSYAISSTGVLSAPEPQASTLPITLGTKIPLPASAPNDTMVVR
jgi:hypothetical protein